DCFKNGTLIFLIRLGTGTLQVVFRDRQVVASRVAQARHENRVCQEMPVLKVMCRGMYSHCSFRISTGCTHENVA
ncbi:MAG: hypothetical protein P8N43_08810, partial [Alphaproteobacteria bacterium]|nr:hypothetical protein [Alphaproteobacteria bacterium]